MPAPNGIGFADGDSYLAPFSTGDNRSSRYQQLNAASLFAALPDGGGWIVNILFRNDPFLADPQGGGIYTVPSVQLNLSTTCFSEDHLQSIFDLNTGPNDQSVISQSKQYPVFLGGGGSSSFGGGFVLDQPFFYRAAEGNLLIDFRVYQGGSAVPFFPPGGARLDAFDRPGDGVSSVFAYGEGDLPSAGVPTSLGLATEFVFLPIPRLTMSRQSGGYILLRWNYRPDGFVLEQSPALGPAASWQPVVGRVTTNGVYKEITLPINVIAPARFFRLILPESASAPSAADLQAAGESIVISTNQR